MMSKALETIKASRKAMLTLIESLTNEQLNKIPPGFNNNLAWQLGHIMVSQQILCYKLGNQNFVISSDLIDRYKNGSKPESYITEEEVLELKTLLLSTITQLEVDLAANKFANYTPYTISTYKNFTLNNINDAIQFIVSHDGLHYGCSLMLKKFV